MHKHIQHAHIYTHNTHIYIYIHIHINDTQYSVNLKMLSVGHIFIVMLSAVMPSAIMLVVVAPAKHHFTIYKKDVFDEYIGVGKN